MGVEEHDLLPRRRDGRHEDLSLLNSEGCRTLLHFLRAWLYKDPALAGKHEHNTRQTPSLANKQGDDQ